MMNTVALVFIAGIMGGALNASGVMDVFVNQVLMKLAKSVKSLIVTTMLYSYFILFISGSQPLGVVMGGTTFKEAYEEENVHKKFSQGRWRIPPLWQPPWFHGSMERIGSLYDGSPWNWD